MTDTFVVAGKQKSSSVSLIFSRNDKIFFICSVARGSSRLTCVWVVSGTGSRRLRLVIAFKFQDFGRAVMTEIMIKGVPATANTDHQMFFFQKLQNKNQTMTK